MRGVILALLMMLTFELSGQQVEFDKRSHNFGTIAEVDGLARVVFTYKNVSDRPFIITSVITSCGCTSPKYRKEPLMPGREAQIEVAFNPEGRPGYFSKDIVIYSDSRKREDRLIISGSVTPRPLTLKEQFPVDGGSGLWLSTSLISMPPIDRGRDYTQIIDIYNGSDREVVLSGRTNRGVAKVAFGSSRLAPGGATHVSYTLPLGDSAPLGYFTDSLYVDCDGVSSARQVKVEAIVVPDFSRLSREEMAAAPQIEMPVQFHHFLSVDSGSRPEYEFTITNRGKRPLLLEKIYSSSPALSYSVASCEVAAGGSTTITLRLNTRGHVGRMSEKVTIICNDPSMPVKDLRVAASVKAQ